MRQPITAVCVLAAATCAADGVNADDPPQHDHGQQRDGVHHGHNPDGLFAMWNPAIECPPELDSGGAS